MRPAPSAARARAALAVLALLPAGVLALQSDDPEDCLVEGLEPSLQRLGSRHWLCEQKRTGRTDTDDLGKCIGEGHTINNTALCQGRWQWYQVFTSQQHEVAYYEMAEVDGSLQRVRRTRTERLDHALSIDVQAAYCPYTDCASDGKVEYYTKVDVLVVDGPMLHPWNAPVPFPEGEGLVGDYSDYYKGERLGKLYRYYAAWHRVLCYAMWPCRAMPC
jgi:hypothetical protein